MSLMLEFRPPKNREARLAGIGTKWCFPTVTLPTDAAECKLEGLPLGKAEGRPTHQSSKAIAAHSLRDPLIASPALRKLPVNDLLTNSGNSD